MSNKELDNYMKTVNPNFDSHIEKGTIEMSNEYYNLLEEKMARLINENQELKEKLDKYENPEDMTLIMMWCTEKVKDENKKIKKKYLNAVADYETTMTEKNKLETQQKEFINYLEDEIKRINPKELNISELNLRLDDIKFTQYLIYKEILQKYKSIIGVSDEKK